MVEITCYQLIEITLGQLSVVKFENNYDEINYIWVKKCVQKNLFKKIQKCENFLLTKTEI